MKSVKAVEGSTLPNDDIVLITNGYRNQLDTKEGLNYLTFPSMSDGPFSTQDEVIAHWIKSVEEADEDVTRVAGGGTATSLFSKAFTVQVSAIASPKNVFCPTMGYGLVNLTPGVEYAAYDFGEAENTLTPEGSENWSSHQRDWWDTIVKDMPNSLSFSQVTIGALRNGQEIVIALPDQRYTVYRNDLVSIFDAIEASKIYEYVRIVGGPETANYIPAELLPCLMSSSDEALDVLVPGVKAHKQRRRAYALVYALGSGFKSPKEDRQIIKELYTNPQEALTDASLFTTSVKTREEISPEELTSLVTEFMELIGEDPTGIYRMIRARGLKTTDESIVAVIKELTSEKKPANKKQKA
jgi:hypothetical protein